MSPSKRTSRASTAASEIYFSRLRNGHVDRLIDHPTPATDNYDQAVDAVITHAVGTGVIKTTTGVCPPILKKHKHDPSVRLVQFNPEQVKRASRVFNLCIVGNAAAFYEHRSGYDVAQNCSRYADPRIRTAF